MSLPFHHNDLMRGQKRPEIMNSQVVFGTPSQNCSGSGICKVYTIHGAKRLSIDCEMVMARLALLDAELQVLFTAQTCTEQLLQKHFKQEQFLVEEIFQLPSWLSRKWQLPTAFVPIGCYPIQRLHGLIGLKLPLNLVGPSV